MKPYHICIAFPGNKNFEAQANLSKNFKGLIQMYFVQKKISPGVPCHVNWCVFTVFSKVEEKFSGIPVISSLYILWTGRICPCVRCTWVVPSTHRRRATEVQTRTPPYGHVAGGTANARWRYREGTVPVRWTCLRCGIFCVRFGASEARRPQETCVAGTVAAESLSDPDQPQETQNLRRTPAAAPDTQEP